ncbi:hypothetical protein [Pseudofulvibacter geojedonensis]|uniref:BRCT domain-containing protein n=1 Tax=Pseudofulvibacter geojedonensis TaxID=1123758 RepID=A0ABW3I0Q3_9FLAO
MTNSEILVNFLTNRGWTLEGKNPMFFLLKPNIDFSFPENYLFKIPHNYETIDFDSFYNKSLEIISEIYDLKHDDLIKIIEQGSEILSLRIVDSFTEDGSISLQRFEKFLEKIKGILSSTASFVINKDPLFSKSSIEVEQYINHCNFLQTEKGSFISKINLPTNTLLVNNSLFEEDAIYASDVNNRIKNTISYLNHEIFSNKDIMVDYNYIQENRQFINLKLLKQYYEFYTKVEIQNIEFSFDNIEYSDKILVNDMNGYKLSRLDSFINQVDEILNADSNISVVGKIISLSSRNPDGTTNSIKVSGVTDDGELKPIVITANLTSEDYRKALEFHGEKTRIRLTGLAKKEKTYYKYLRLDSFENV